MFNGPRGYPWGRGDGFGTMSDPIAASAFHAFEQIHNPNAQRLGYQMEARQRNVHPAVLKCTNLGPMEPGFVGKLILRQTTLLSQLPNPCA
jgi:hypothetical protein